MVNISETTQKILDELADSVVSLDEIKAVELSHKALEYQVDAYSAITFGLARGMDIMGQRYEKGICFVPELLIASDAMYAGMDVLKPHLKKDSLSVPVNTFKGVIGVIEGDTHDIGKNLVKIMFEADGFVMTDLGRDVPAKKFVDTAVKEQSDVICISSLMTTAMNGMKDVITTLVKEGIRDKVKVMVGGACVSPVFAQKIGADGYAPSAGAAVKLGRKLLEIGS